MPQQRCAPARYDRSPLELFIMMQFVWVTSGINDYVKIVLIGSNPIPQETGSVYPTRHSHYK